MQPEFGQLLNRCIDEPTTARIVHFKRRIKDPAKLVARFVTWVEGEALSDPGQSLSLCSLSIRLSAAVHSECLTSRAFNVLAAVHQALEQEGKAKKALEISLAHDASCLSCAAACLRFRARFLLKSEKHEGARRTVEQAIEKSRELEDEDGEGRALVYRGYYHYEAENIKAAIQDAETALQKLDLLKSPNFHSAALLNLVGYLAQGSQADAIQSLALIPKVEAAFEGLRHRTLQRATVKWVKGLLSVRAGYTAKGETHLRSARTILIQLGLPSEVAAITADIATLAHPDRKVIRSLLRQTLRLDLDWGETKSLLNQVWESTRTKNAFVEGDPHGEIIEAIKGLRESINGELIPPPCLNLDLQQPEADLLGFG